jgi:hypothetical protein
MLAEEKKPGQLEEGDGWIVSALARVNLRLAEPNPFPELPISSLSINPKRTEETGIPLTLNGGGRNGKRAPKEQQEPTKDEKLVASWPQTFEGVKLQASGVPDEAQIYRAIEASGRRWVVLMIHRCGRGPGLLPVTKSLNSEPVWVAPPDIRITLAEYMRQFLFFFTNESWDDRIEQVFDGHVLPRYQCTVQEEHWRRCWDTLQTPFNKMCAAYRRILGGKSAPHIRFGVPPRLLDGKATVEDPVLKDPELPVNVNLPSTFNPAMMKEKPPIDNGMLPLYPLVLPPDLHEMVANPMRFSLDHGGHPSKQYVPTPADYNWNFLLPPA